MNEGAMLVAEMIGSSNISIRALSFFLFVYETFDSCAPLAGNLFEYGGGLVFLLCGRYEQ